MSSSRNSQSSFKAMLAQSNPAGIKDNTRVTGANAIGSGLMGKRTPRGGIRSPKTPGRAEVSAHSRGHRISAKRLNPRGSINGANLIFTSTDGGFKRTFTQGAQRNQGHTGVLPQIDTTAEKKGNSERRFSVQKLQEPEHARHASGSTAFH